MKWPRGKYNGRPIVGVSVELALYLDRWNWYPRFVREVGGFHWFCFCSFWRLTYGWDEK